MTGLNPEVVKSLRHRRIDWRDGVGDRGYVVRERDTIRDGRVAESHSTFVVTTCSGQY